MRRVRRVRTVLGVPNVLGRGNGFALGTVAPWHLGTLRTKAPYAPFAPYAPYAPYALYALYAPYAMFAPSSIGA